nr:MAG TPA: hypothetical protein [Bacteriophage sp.]
MRERGGREAGRDPKPWQTVRVCHGFLSLLCP